ncbi:ribbon-helix-helix protein, CopG family [Aetokthonos hydrillicola Thurmond2011]|jgi:predicted DNA-binding protein|uniref:Ribbon-helix-helix protein, CopG family n=1 Tax=Aetokthonos hydrillicola Thurmond2011 TaxID=2712845 RepID=A0AAP5MCG6_9CYAN|nr:ribbon-helix-helix protein, CopG family [Aetokthonos hydrillicola]MBO3463093.1 ribbon-helix-helix protein, CopG family [Aetokthonos hydrillicola CCALA 1050]MDR9900305.1 ribbon-helix-helix protein, CopG family [Aetokthonos hydrillicola Thurmond2011]
MASPQFSVRLPQELDERLNAYVKQAGITKTKVMLDALAHYLGCADDVPLIRRVMELEERMAALEAKSEK